VRTNSDNYRDEPPTDRFPADIEEWSLEEQISHVAMRQTREGLLAALLSHAGLNPREFDLRADRKLYKRELAAIYLTLEGVSSQGRDAK